MARTSVDNQMELDILLNPVVIVEVLSRRTKNYDRGKDFREYLLTAQTNVYVKHHVLEYSSRPVWTMTGYCDFQYTIYLSIIDVTPQ